MKCLKVGVYFAAAIAVTSSHAAIRYELEIKCPNNTLTFIHYHTVDSYSEAQNRASGMLETWSDYQGRGCRVISLRRD